MTAIANGPARTAAEVYTVLADLERPCYIVDNGGVAATNDEGVARAGGTVLAAVPPMGPDRLGAPDFTRDHGVRHAYMAGAMANGIASARMVGAMAQAGYLASYGAASTVPAKVDEALAEITRTAQGAPFACNLIHSPSELAMERSTVDLCLRHRVRCVEASAFLDLTPQIVRYRAVGLRRGANGEVVADNRVIAKVSRAEVAERFIRPAPESILRGLVAAGDITAEQAELARSAPVADDITAEADSGGHTDRRPLPVLLPDLLRLRDMLQAELHYRKPVRIGAAGGIGTPAAAFAAYAMGAAYVVTGSINQAAVESGQSPAVKRLLATAGVADCEMAPSSDMFELGVDVQILKRGTMFPSRAKKLYELYRLHEGIDAIPAATRAELEQKVFRRPLEDVWTDTVAYFAERDPEQVERARGNEKRRMALIFRWYLGLSSRWSMSGDADRAQDYQIWCGPAMGAFNTWAHGTFLAPVENRHVATLADQVLRGAAFAARVSALRFAGVRLPAACATYRPAPTA
ncbi:PfaD family polyunsaturated fatty acid/polyketide biosynthesis protein [Actinokineospora sp. NBRC 105648]|uniref:PfaD family polyunsaturated fatty acid/polyketide biosynthesis protein n=1 Tax=Actinokineospora sp. NBRC 105648 TaxID=3032206 RepID=UPI0024A0B754|nr:PfaD family polyunsaturated fatty acid/polyketide biosynthesis protein [Actinokineospora sp. NBRC 105648]GLZ36542.1 2-nitropropane dioxygenase [Actinokineospora sp. NBRC 105648]